MLSWLVALALSAASTPPPPRVFIAGDSTAADFGPANPIIGWGVPLRCAIGNEVINLAQGGRTARAYGDEGFWSTLVARLRPGDVVLIQFGHNDGFQHLDPDREYRPHLEAFVRDVVAVGARPVIVTPVARNLFADQVPLEAHGPFTKAAQAAADATGSALIDLDAESLAMLRQLGPAAADALYLPDRTHFTVAGAHRVADLVASNLVRLGIATTPMGDCEAQP